MLNKIELYSVREKFLEYLKNQNKASATILAYGKDLSQLNQFLTDLGKKTVDQIEKTDIEAFLKKLGADGFTAKSLSRKLNSIKTFYRFLRSQSFVQYDQTLEIAHPKYETKAPRILSKMEYRALRDACREDIRISAIVEIFLQTGLRISELANLKLTDAKKSELQIQALESHEERMVPLNKAAATALENYLKIRPQTKETTIFITKTGKPLLIRNIRTALDRYFRLAGIENACVNDLRHTFIAQQLGNGTPVNVISKLVGHKRLSTTEKYLGLIQDKVVENVKLEEL
mgnify:CR=1 FL=1